MIVHLKCSYHIHMGERSKFLNLKIKNPEACNNLQNILTKV